MSTDSFNSKLDEILDSRFRGLAALAYAECDGYRPEVEKANEKFDHIKKQSKQAIIDLFKSNYIGDDEPDPEDPRTESGAEWNRRMARNEFRKYLRAILDGSDKR